MSNEQEKYVRLARNGNKIGGVEGAKILPDLKDELTQDFLLGNHPTIAAGDVSSYLKQDESIKIVLKP